MGSAGEPLHHSARVGGRAAHVAAFGKYEGHAHGRERRAGAPTGRSSGLANRNLLVGGVMGLRLRIFFPREDSLGKVQFWN